MGPRHLIVIGASAGGIDPLRELIAGLPTDLPASVLVVLHMPPTGGEALRRILAHSSSLPVTVAEDGAALDEGVVTVAPGGRHLLVGRGHVHVRNGPRENGHRPAIDPLFRSAAAFYGPRAVGVILSGNLNDGAAGLLSVKGQGGLAVVQDPEEALYDSMPTSALEYVEVDHVTRAAEMGPLLGELVLKDRESATEPIPDPLRIEVELMETETGLTEQHPGKPSPWPCPDCQGVLWEIEEGPMLRFRCRVGHAWAAESLLHEQAQGVEGALWMALRALEDRADLSERLALRAEAANRRISASRHRQELESTRRNVTILQQLLSGGQFGSESNTGVAGDEGATEADDR